MTWLVSKFEPKSLRGKVWGGVGGSERRVLMPEPRNPGAAPGEAAHCWGMSHLDSGLAPFTADTWGPFERQS